MGLGWMLHRFYMEYAWIVDGLSIDFGCIWDELLMVVGLDMRWILDGLICLIWETNTCTDTKYWYSLKTGGGYPGFWQSLLFFFCGLRATVTSSNFWAANMPAPLGAGPIPKGVFTIRHSAE